MDAVVRLWTFGFFPRDQPRDACARRRWQRIEAAAWAGERRPLWLWLAAAGLILLWALAAQDFARAHRNWAGWGLIAGVPAIWGLKAVLLVFNPRDRQAVSGVNTDTGWRRIGLARLPVAIVLAALSALA